MAVAPPQVLTAPHAGFYTSFSCLDSSRFASTRTLILDDGSIWTAYGATFCVQSWTEDYMSGFWQGHLDSAGSKSAGDVRLFGVWPPMTVNLHIGYDATQSHIFSDMQFSTGDMVRVADSQEFDPFVRLAPATIGAVEGDDWRYSGLVADGGTDNGNGFPVARVRVSSNGDVQATLAGDCSATGKLVAHPHSKDVFEVVLTFGAGPCPLGGLTLRGVAVPIGSSAKAYYLTVMAVDDTRAHGFFIDLWRN